MRKNITYCYYVFFITCSALSLNAQAKTQISSGVWYNYSYQTEPSSNANQESWGTLGNEAFVLYLDHQAETSPWQFSAEFRAGPGSFTDPLNNSTGSNYVLHKAWLGYHFDNNSLLKIGKTAVPFGWRTTNFWPGDMLLGGYGDQKDVGISYRITPSETATVSLAYFHADDWGASSTDTADDNGHWGSSMTYRKGQTLVADLQWNFIANHSVGVSLQAGLLQDLNNSAANDEFGNTSGHHQALALYYSGQIADSFTIKTQFDMVQRKLPDSLSLEKIDNTRAAITAIYSLSSWDIYLDITAANTNTKDNQADTIFAFAPGAKYDYGNGWFYIEYLHQNGDIDRNGDSYEGDFSALYLTVDYYFSF